MRRVVTADTITVRSQREEGVPFFPKPISNRLPFFTHCAKEQPSTARDGGTSMLVGEHLEKASAHTHNVRLREPEAEEEENQ